MIVTFLVPLIDQSVQKWKLEDGNHQKPDILETDSHSAWQSGEISCRKISLDDRSIWDYLSRYRQRCRDHMMNAKAPTTRMTRRLV
jgi:hypothetical protein